MTEPLALTATTRSVLHALFPANAQARAERTLVADCGPAQVHSPTFGAQAMERIWLAAIRKSGGDLAVLDDAVRLARTDWRDLLVGAGFAHRTDAHLEWAAAITA